ncbi:unnamed protein product [Prunus armeniaca]
MLTGLCATKNGYFMRRNVVLRDEKAVGYVAGLCIPEWDRALTGGIRNYGQKVDTEPEQMHKRILGWNR